MKINDDKIETIDFFKDLSCIDKLIIDIWAKFVVYKLTIIYHLIKIKKKYIK